MNHSNFWELPVTGFLIRLMKGFKDGTATLADCKAFLRLEWFPESLAINPLLDDIHGSDLEENYWYDKIYRSQLGDSDGVYFFKDDVNDELRISKNFGPLS